MIDPIVEVIIKSGDRAELKQRLSSWTDTELCEVWVRLQCCRVQDFGSLALTEMRRRGIIKN